MKLLEIRLAGLTSAVGRDKNSKKDVVEAT